MRQMPNTKIHITVLVRISYLENTEQNENNNNNKLIKACVACLISSHHIVYSF